MYHKKVTSVNIFYEPVFPTAIYMTKGTKSDGPCDSVHEHAAQNLLNYAEIHIIRLNINN